MFAPPTHPLQSAHVKTCNNNIILGNAAMCSLWALVLSGCLFTLVCWGCTTMGWIDIQVNAYDVILLFLTTLLRDCRERNRNETKWSLWNQYKTTLTSTENQNGINLDYAYHDVMIMINTELDMSMVQNN